ncbi:MAG: hypothetical protein ACMXYF_00575 [Candidatus Woesearchaeota archaeon]
MQNEQLISDAVYETTSFEQLFELLKQLKTIQTQKTTYDAQKIIQYIQEVRSRIREPNYIPRIYGLRLKVIDLCDKQPLQSRVLQELENENNMFFTIQSNKFPLSGWKIHIFCENIQDVAFAYNLMKQTLEHFQLIVKLSTKRFFKECSPNQKGKGITIYIHQAIITENRLTPFLQKIQTNLSEYNKAGAIHGDNQYWGPMHYRYDFLYPTTKFPEGCPVGSEKKYYRTNNGKYNIENNPDPFLN